MQSKHDFMLKRRSVLRCAGGLLAGASLGVCTLSFSQQRRMRLAAGSDLRFALTEIVHSFEQTTGLGVDLTYGSSGNLARQIEQGLPMDLFLSADESFVLRLHQRGWSTDEGVIYAQGQLAVVAPTSSPLPLDAGLDSLWTLTGKLAIANPDHAPYGRAARSALQAAGLWQRVQAQLVLAENVNQAMQFVNTGAAPCGLVALALALAPSLARDIRGAVVSQALYPPLLQRMGMAKTAPASARRLYEHLQSEAARSVFKRYGFK